VHVVGRRGRAKKIEIGDRSYFRGTKQQMADLTELSLHWRDVQDEDDQWQCRRWCENNFGCAQLLASGSIVLLTMVSFIAGYYTGAYRVF
jgi:hypothetical protein